MNKWKRLKLENKEERKKYKFFQVTYYVPRKYKRIHRYIINVNKSLAISRIKGNIQKPIAFLYTSNKQGVKCF